MKHLRRIIFRFLTATSAVQCVVLAAFWARSCWVSDHAGALSGRASPPLVVQFSVYSFDGLLTWQLKWNTDAMEAGEKPPPSCCDIKSVPRETLLGSFG